MQVQVDISTPPEVFDRLEATVTEHISANPLDFSGESSVNANFGTDPMKFLLVVWWNYCYNGAGNCELVHASHNSCYSLNEVSCG